MCLRREHRNYNISEITSSPSIRALCDTVQMDEQQDDVDPPCLVFEWMDHDLRAITAPEFRSQAKFPKAVSKAVLSPLDVLKRLDAIHTESDVNPNNIYLSNIDGSSPVAKLGDLGNVIKDASTSQRLQSLPCRAPEVWRGLPCRHASDIWSLGVTLTTKSSQLLLFGPTDKKIEGNTEAWCIAKIMCLVGPLGTPIAHQPYKNEFELADQLAVMQHPLGGMKLVNRGHWREELEDIPDPPVPSDLLDFIASLLIIDPDKRPTAAEALLHPYLQSNT